MLLHFKLLNLTESTDAEIKAIKLDSPSSLELSSRAATILRASSLACCQQLVECAQGLSSELPWLADVTEDGLDSYLWTIAKDQPELRKLARVRESGTVMY